MAARLLIVEDNIVNLELMSYILNAAGYAVSAVTSGPAALAALRERRFDLVVCDVQMPGMDGVQLLGALRSNAEVSALPVIAVTAAAMVGDRERFLAAGFDGYIAKPIDPKGFAEQVAAFLTPQSPTNLTEADHG